MTRSRSFIVHTLMLCLPLMTAWPAFGQAPDAQHEAVPTFSQQTCYHVDPIKVRIVGHEDFKIHRMELSAKVVVGPANNGTLTCYGKCTNGSGLWHWGDCAQYEGQFSIEVYVHARYEHDPSGLQRPGYAIGRREKGALRGVDADDKVLFFNGPPPNAVVGPHCDNCPYRLVINTKSQNELVQAISMEPIYKVPSK